MTLKILHENFSSAGMSVIAKKDGKSSGTAPFPVIYYPGVLDPKNAIVIMV